MERDICDVEYRKGPYCQKLYFELNGHFCSKFNTHSRTYSVDLHPERRIWQFYYILSGLLLIDRIMLRPVQTMEHIPWHSLTRQPRT